MLDHLPLEAALVVAGRGPVELRVKQLEDDLRGMQRGVAFALVQLLDLRDLNTGLHATRLADWAVRVGELVGLEGDALRDVEMASLLHDVGKIGVPDGVLKKAGPLDAAEAALVRKHPEYGWAILRTIPGFEAVSLLVLHHHEHWDGSGYPGRLVAECIPLGSRIVAVVDAFDAMLDSRTYRHGLPVDEALRRLHEGRGSQFCPTVVDRFTTVVAPHLEELATTQHRIREA